MQLQKCFYLFKGHTRHLKSIHGFETVKKRHFSVLVLSSSDPQKLSVALRYLAYPPFIKLPDAAEQEFGFNQKGVLIIPCEASKLKVILS
ncbi:hypothetical protein Patl1_32158 [Pistacia atlantica]|uniref:Uncharacterized protein n=1 Tax=Pistacia atlantica TaxID=434234 RepID=A0ACC1AML9_9ROSI|nr:hypothetical protein Patl1_32158 [Pistacia atlantica]